MIASAIKLAFLGFLLFGAGSAAYAADRAALRICADPANMPFSNQNLDGFENKVADLFAKTMNLPVTYAWFPQTIGFIRNTLKAKKCDLILGAVADQEPLQSTEPYYKSAYALVYRSDSNLAGIDHLGDARLLGRPLGIIAGTPPATIMAKYGLLKHSKSFPLAVDRRHAAPTERMIARIAKGELDGGILWGPIAGYFAQQNGGDLTVTPLLKETEGPQMTFPITMGVRHGDQDWKRTVDKFIASHRSEIDSILVSFAVPLVK